MQGYYERDPNGFYIQDCRGNLVETGAATYRSQFGTRQTPSAVRAERNQFAIRAAVITVIVGLAGLYMYVV